MKYFIILLLVCCQAFAQVDPPVDPTTSDSLEEDIVGTITPPTHEQVKVAQPKAEKQDQVSKKSLKSQLKKKHKNKKHKEKLKDKKNKKIKKNKKHKNK